tara:strand:+ start:76 stop:330 length:255 start_codon:yes stop_codon:yes gene_type:complete
MSFNRGSYDRETGMVTGSGGKSRMAGEKLQGLQASIDNQREQLRGSGGEQGSARRLIDERAERRERGAQLKQGRDNRRAARQGA